MTNEAAERLPNPFDAIDRWIAEARAAERKATVERIRAALMAAHATKLPDFYITVPYDEMLAILDAEAAR